MDISGSKAEIHMRTDAKNLVTTASTTHLPEQKETIHMISMMRKEACSGSIADLAHVSSQDCLSDCLTKNSANPDNLVGAIKTGVLPSVDQHPNFRSLMPHKAYLMEWFNCFVMQDILDMSVLFTILDAGRHTGDSRHVHWGDPQGKNSTKITSAFACSSLSSLLRKREFSGDRDDHVAFPAWRS